MTGPWSAKETAFLAEFYRALDTTTLPVPMASVKAYWQLLQAHIDPVWRLPLPADAALQRIAERVSQTRRLDAFYEVPDEAAQRMLPSR